MATLEQQIISVSGRLSHSWDFTFYKNNGEIANRVRAELGSSLKQIRIDNDGDVSVDTHAEGSFFATPTTIFAAGWLTDTKSLSEQDGLKKFAHIIETMARCKGSFAAETYNVRLFFRFTPENGLSLLRSHGYESGLQSILGETTPSEVDAIKFSSSYLRNRFLDSVELEASKQDVQLRYSRSAIGTDFDSYLAFIEAANLKGLTEDLRPFAEFLKETEPRFALRAGLAALGKKK